MKNLSRRRLASILLEHAQWERNNKTGKRAVLRGYEFHLLTFPRGVILEDCRVECCRLFGCVVNRGETYESRLYECQVKGGILTSCHIHKGPITNCKLQYCTVYDCALYRCDFGSPGCSPLHCTFSAGKIEGRQVEDFRSYIGLYPYEVWAVLFADGSRWVRMGCMFHSLDEWERMGIRTSNPEDFPDDGSPRSEERVRAFEFAKNAALALA